VSRTVPTQNNPPRLLRCTQAAHYLSISTKAIRVLILRGELSYVQLKPGGNSPFLLDVRDLDQFIERRKNVPTIPNYSH
jgi:excisionase family DNA binding protein